MWEEFSTRIYSKRLWEAWDKAQGLGMAVAAGPA